MPAILEPELLSQEYSLNDLILPADVADIINYELQESERQGRMFRNTLALTGSGGLGKTSLGLAIGRQIGASKVIMVTAKPDRKEQDRILDSLEDGSLLLLDEIHDYAKQTWLLDTIYGARGLTRDGKRIEFTVFAATTNKGQLPQTVVSRFPIKLHLRYTSEEFQQIVHKLAERFGVDLSVDIEGMKTLLRASNGNPRTCETILGFWGIGDPDEAVRMAQLSPDGLTHDALEMLEYLDEHRRAFGRLTLAKALNAPGGIDDIEAVLVRRKYIVPTPQGLEITRNGVVRVRTWRTEGV